jgi:peptidoglycan hydrolase-like protein with peptidoglycan-binding domain
MTLTTPSILVEYSYIYEPFIGSELFDLTSEVMAEATTLGISEYVAKGVYDISSLSYEWTSLLSPSPKRKPDIIALQYALYEIGMYPPASFTKEKCPLSGIFGPCTKAAVQQFQKSKQLMTSGVLTPSTRTALNGLFQ